MEVAFLSVHMFQPLNYWLDVSKSCKDVLGGGYITFVERI
jgi:hypothetical protein